MCKRITGAALVLVLLLCGTLAFGQAGATTTIGGLPRSQTLIVDILTGKNGTPANFNEWAGWVGQDKGLQQLIDDPLWVVEYTLGQNVPTLAASAPVYNAAFTKMTVKLRKGVTWSDGVPFTADDVVYTVQLQLDNKGMQYYSQMTGNVAKVSKTDDFTVVFDLKKPNAKFDAFFNDRWGALRILPKHVWEKAGDPMTFQNYPPVGTGPYVLKDYDPSGYWFTYERRADWDKSPTGILYGKPAPTYVQFVYYGTPDKKVIAESQHELDMADLTPESFVATQKNNPTIRGLYKEFPWYEINHPCTTGGVFNAQVAPYNDADVRWALNLALNVPEMIMTAYNGATALAPAYVPATLPFYKWFYQPMQPWLVNFTIKVGGKDYKPYDANMPMQLAAQAKKAGYPVPTDKAKINEMFGYGGWKYNPQAAETLLKDKGFTRDKNGKWLLPDGKPWTMSINAPTNPAHPSFKWAFQLGEQWRRFGIDVSVDANEQDATVDQNGSFDVSGAWPMWANGGDWDLYSVVQQYHSKYLVPLGQPLAGGETARFSTPELDKIIDQMEKVASTDPKSQQLGIEAMKILVKYQPGISLGSYVSVLGWDEYYWTNYPGGGNTYTQPHYHWPNFKFMLPRLKPTGKQ